MDATWKTFRQVRLRCSQIIAFTKMPKHELHDSNYVKTLPGGTQNWNYDQLSEKLVCKLCINSFDYKASNVKTIATRNLMLF